jgi:hypothetical protein
MTKDTNKKTKESFPLHEIWHRLARPQCNGFLGRNTRGAMCNARFLQFMAAIYQSSLARDRGKPSLMGCYLSFFLRHD